MKILLSSHLFAPSVGGLETVSRLFADEFVRLGHQVKVVTQTHAQDNREYPFDVFRQPSGRALIRLARWCDVFFHNNISLRCAWPLLFVRRPWVVAHHIWIARPDGLVAWQDRLKRFVLRFATNIAISRAIAEALPVAAEIIPDPYRDDLFRKLPGSVRDKELIFLGRLVSDKGVDLLLDALARLKVRGLRPRLTITGDGPERVALMRQAQKLGLNGQVEFTGAKQGTELVELLNRHQILVVPSRWAEPFGIVALEGIACGCVVVGSERGGLKDAVGPCGVTFPNGDAEALATRLEELLRTPERLLSLRAQAKPHLARHRAVVVAQEYLKVFEMVCSPVRGRTVGSPGFTTSEETLE